jgi:hypothetical protein
MPEDPAGLRCTACDRRIVWRRARRAFMHASEGEAACDLDSDHPPAPDWDALGVVVCRRCGAPVRGAGAGVGHAEASRDADHPADPVLPFG